MGRRQATPCVHHWVLGEPHRGTIRGVCRRCGARRSYPSGLELPEIVSEYEELNRSRPVLVTDTASLEEHAPVGGLALDGIAVSLSGEGRYGSVAAERC